jgi:hypothetical protein
VDTQLAERLKVADNLLAQRNIEMAGTVLGVLKERYPHNEEVMERLAKLAELRLHGQFIAAPPPIGDTTRRGYAGLAEGAANEIVAAQYGIGEQREFVPASRGAIAGVIVVFMLILGGVAFWGQSRLKAGYAARPYTPPSNPISEFNNDMHAAQQKEAESYKKALEEQKEIQKRTDEGAEVWQK